MANRKAVRGVLLALAFTALVSLLPGRAFAAGGIHFTAETLSERVQILPRDGSLRYGESDVEMNATGFALALRRCYSSINTNEGVFGPGWACVLDTRLEKTAPDRVVLRDEWGEAVVFTERRSSLFLSQTGRAQWLWLEPDGALLRDQHGRLLSFNKSGRLDGIYNAAMAGVEIEYEEERPAVMRDTYGRSIRFKCDASGRLIEARSSAGQIRRYDYAKNRLAHVLDDEGVRVEYAYDGAGRLSAITVGGAERAEIAYDPQGRVVQLGGGGLAPRAVRYREATVPFRARVTEIADALGHVMRYRFREEPNEAQITLPGGAAATVDYDKRRLPVRIDLPQGRRIELQYDDTGNLTRLILPGNTGFAFGYTGRGDLKQWTRADGATFAFDRSESGLIREVRGQRPDAVRRFGFDLQGRLAWLADGAERAIAFSQNSWGDLSSIALASSATALLLDHDEAGRLGRIAPAGRPAFGAVYGPNGRPEALTDSVGYRLALVRDRLGRLAAIEDCEKHREQLERDNTGRPSVWRRPDGAETRLAFDREGNLAQVVLPEGNSCTVLYNERNLPTSDTAVGVVHHLQYDEFGCIVSRQDEAGQIVRLLYNPMGRPTEMIRDPQDTARFQYGLDGRVLGMVARDSDYRFGSDPAGRSTRIAESRSGLWAEYQFDSTGRVIALAALGGRCVYQYDGQGRLVRYVLAGEKPLEVGYAYESDQARLPARVLLPGGTNVAYEYDAYGRPSSIRATLPSGKTALSERDGYDGRGNLVRVESAGRRVEFEYDAQNRLAVQRLNGQLYERLSYGRDGRLLKMEGDAGNLELAYAADGAPIRSSKAKFEYDVNGNRMAQASADGTTQYRFDRVGRLIAVMRPTGSTVSRTYSPNGWPSGRISRGRRVGLFFLGDLPLFGSLQGESGWRRLILDPLWGGPLGMTAGGQTELAYRDGLGRLKAVGGGDTTRQVAWGLLGRRPQQDKQLFSDLLSLDTLDFDPETNLSDSFDPAGGVSLTPRSLREGLAAYSRSPLRPPLPSWAGAVGRSAGNSETALLEELAASCAAGRFAPADDAILRYLIASVGSPGWPDVGSEETFDRILERSSFLTPPEIARCVIATVLRDGTGGLSPLAFAPHLGVPPAWLGLGRYRTICPTLNILPPVVLEEEMIGDTVWRDDPSFAAPDNARQGWMGRLVARAADRAEVPVGQDGCLRLLGELMEITRWTIYAGPRQEGESLPTAPEVQPPAAMAERLARRDRMLKALDVTP